METLYTILHSKLAFHVLTSNPVPIIIVRRGIQRLQQLTYFISLTFEPKICEPSYKK